MTTLRTASFRWTNSRRLLQAGHTGFTALCTQSSTRSAVPCTLSRVCRTTQIHSQTPGPQTPTRVVCNGRANSSEPAPAMPALKCCDELSWQTMRIEDDASRERCLCHVDMLAKRELCSLPHRRRFTMRMSMPLVPSRLRRQNLGLLRPRDISHGDRWMEAASCLWLRDRPAPSTGEQNDHTFYV